MRVNKAEGRAFAPTDCAGIDGGPFRNNDDGGGRSSIARLARGSRFPRDAHHGSEEVVVPAGTEGVGGCGLTAGDRLFTEPGEEQDVVAVSDARVLVSFPARTPVVE